MDEQDTLGAMVTKVSPNSENERSFDLVEALLDATMRPEARRKIRENLRDRRNIANLNEHLPPPTRDEFLKSSSERLWIVDRILEPQTVAHFVASLNGKDLPGSVASESDLSRKDLSLMYKPYSSWALPPFDTIQRSPIDKIMTFVGSMEDPSGLQIISKELHAMKSRLWEGVMPVSARRWHDRGLDTPAQFSVACRIISMAISVFLYLNSPRIQSHLREIYNRIYDELNTFERAWGAKCAAEGKPEPKICRVWHDYMRAHLDVMTRRTHAWIIDCIGPMKASVLEQLAAHQPTTTDEYDDVQWMLTDMWQDLEEISAQADYAILIAMDGYKGSAARSDVVEEYDFHTQPLSVKLNLDQRREEYHLRRRHLYMKATTKAIFEGLSNAGVGIEGVGVRGIGTPGIGVLDELTPKNDPYEITKSCRQAEAVRQIASNELHGETVRYEKEPWASILWDNVDWGFVAYRTHPSCSDDEWATFIRDFEADVSDWGHELPGITSLRERSKIHWIDCEKLNVQGQDMEALKSAFKAYAKTSEFPSDFSKEIFLVADEASISSYRALPTNSPSSAGSRGFILAVDAEFDPEEGLSRPYESPGYDGTLRVLGSLLWDDLSALVATQTQHMEDLWPLAMNHEDRVYTGYKSDSPKPLVVVIENVVNSETT